MVDIVYILILTLLFVTAMLVTFVGGPEWNQVFAYAMFMLFSLFPPCTFMSGLGFLSCGVLATSSATVSVPFVVSLVAFQPIAQAIVFDQVSFPLFALHVLLMSLAIPAVYFMRAHQEVTDCSMRHRHPPLAFATPEMAAYSFSIFCGLVGVSFLVAKARPLRSAHSKPSTVTAGLPVSAGLH